MDSIDLKIIGTLRDNSRASYKEIARGVKISDVAVHKRIKNLKKRGVNA
jgi:DNA-binding Lrp family transcriptional regulator